MTRKNVYFLICICIVAFFLCVFRIKETYILAEDVARDTLKVLSMWQTKDITLIGPPASFSLNSDNRFYFGSFIYYFGLLGLLTSNFDPVGAVIPTILLFIVSIPFFFKFFENIHSNKFIKIAGTILYSTSPLVITHMRFFWNPNMVIPLSVFFWYLVTLRNSKKEFEIYFLAGVIMAVIFNLHYFTVLPMMIWLLMVILKKYIDKVLGLVSGFFIGSLPLMIHELSTDYSLFSSLLDNLTAKSEITATLPVIIGRTGEIFMTVLGLKHGEIYFPSVFGNYVPGFWLVFILIAGLVLVTLRQKIRDQKIWLFISLLITIIFSAKYSNTVFYTRYVFGALPLIIWFTAEMFDGKIRRILGVAMLVPVLVSTFGILNFQNGVNTGYIPLKTLEKMSEVIVRDETKGNFNLTENVDGDAYALALRYYVQKDSLNKPKDTNMYGWLDRLYVVAPSLERIQKENRYEFYASGPWKDPIISEFGEVDLFRFDK